jgi:hypothetical protein
MERKFNKKAETFVSDFKKEICDKMKASGLATEQLGALVEFIYEYPRLTFDKEDFVKRKRVKNTIPITNRCAAKRANGEQCTRKKKDDCDFCGTHYKSAPHGLMVCQEIEKKKTEIYTEDINGIIYYIDDNQNVYKIDEVIQNNENPAIIAKYERGEDGQCKILEFY